MTEHDVHGESIMSDVLADYVLDAKRRCIVTTHHRPAAYHAAGLLDVDPEARSRVTLGQVLAQGQEPLQQGDRTVRAVRWVRWRIYPRSVHGTAARVYQVRAATPWRTMRLPPPRKTTNNVSSLADRTFTFCCGSRIALNGGHRDLARHRGAPGPGAATSTRALDVASPAGRSTRTIERQATRHRLDLPGGDDIAPAVRARRRQRQPHVDREARQAARAPPRPRLPTLGMHRRKMSADQPLVAHDAVPCRRIHRGPTASDQHELIARRTSAAFDPVHAVRAVVLAHLTATPSARTRW